MGANPSIDRCLVALHRRLVPPYGCVVRGENVSRRTVSRWVRLHAVRGMQLPPPMRPAKRKHPEKPVLRTTGSESPPTRRPCNPKPPPPEPSAHHQHSAIALAMRSA